MDAKDKKILVELIKNSRIPITQLSKRVRLSREVCIYRIKKLEKEIISGYYTVLNYSSLGFNRYIMFLQLKGITASEEEEYLSYLKSHEFVTYLGPVIGKWNIVLDVMAKDETHLKQIVQQLTQKAGVHLESYIINGTGIEEEIFPTKYFETQMLIINKKIISDYKIDNVDRTIMKELSINSRMEYSELSKKLKMSANAIKYRIKNLEKTKIIQGYTISIDYRKLGYTYYNLQIKFSKPINEKFYSYIRTHKKVMFYYKYLGQENWDLDIGIIAKDALEFRSTIIELKNNFGELIKIHDMYLVAEVIKDNIAPVGVFK